MKAILAFFLSIALLYFLGSEWLDSIEREDNEVSEENQIQSENNIEKNNEITVQHDDFFLHEWIGQDVAVVDNTYGEPDRIDETPFGYEWFIYFSDGPLVMIGVKEEEIVTVYTNSEDVTLDGITVGEDYDTIDSLYSFEKSQTVVNSGLKSVTFELREPELLARPLVKIEDGIWAQLYFDTFKEELSSVRYIDEESLIKHRPYSMTSMGELPETVDWEEESQDSQKKWESGQQKQILDLTNGIRVKHELSTLEGHDQTSEVAYLHSKDMHDEEYFSHTSPTHGGLGDRLEGEQIYFQLAAENIAAHYVDGIEAVEGWLNSEGHRVNLLNDEFTHLGVGVYRDYYTQNFLVPR